MSKRVLFASELADYVVCPESWRLKYLEQNIQRSNLANPEKTLESKKLKFLWLESQEQTRKLGIYSFITLILLFLVALLVFLFEGRRTRYLGKIISSSEISQLKIFNDFSFSNYAAVLTKNIPADLVALILVLGLVIFIWDLFERRKNAIRRSSGLEDKTKTLGVRGNEKLPIAELYSDKLRLKVRPDAIIDDLGETIPVYLCPSSSKIRDRHVIPLIASICILHELGKKSSYGILIVGKKQQRTKIKFSNEKGQWLLNILAEMRAIEAGIPAQAMPALAKCKNCDVRKQCNFSLYVE